MEVLYTPLSLIGYLRAKVPKNILNELNFKINNIITNNFENTHPYNPELAGIIEHEITLPEPGIELLSPFILNLSRMFWEFEYNSLNVNKSHKITSAWINFQKKYEHNPIHRHDGDLSFVIWLKIPFDLEKEKKFASSANSNSVNTTASFAFVFLDSDLGISTHHITMDKDKEGEIIIFNSSLRHLVYPFYTSDEYRISIAGNIKAV